MALLDKHGLNKLIDNLNKNINSKVNFVKNSINTKIDIFFNKVVCISKPIIEYNGTKYIIGVTKDGELTCGVTDMLGEQMDIIVESPNGTLFKVIPTSNCELTTNIVDEGIIKDIYLQAPNPYGIIFKIGVLDDGTLITSTISDVRLVDDNILSKEMSWSSSKINKSIDIVRNSVGSVSSLVDKLNSNVNGLSDDISNLNGLTNQLSESINNKLDRSSIITSTSEPSDSDGKDGDIWIMYEE